MKKLSQLIAYKNELDKLSTEHARTTANLELGKITLTTDDQKLINSLATLNNNFDVFEKLFEEHKRQLLDKISVAERPWIIEAYNMYDQDEEADAESTLALRQSNQIESTPFKDRLKKYADWRYSAIIIRPGLESFIEDMVAYDPLYLVDLSYDYLRPAMEKFNELYRRRLRPYVIKENIEEEILEKLPDKQFGLCLAFNYFNFRPMEILKKYLEEIYQKLKPGGVFVFTFNDCDRRAAVELVERHYCCYTPGHLVRSLLEIVGYEIVYSWHDEGPTTWIEVRRPGVLESIKGGQTLARILPKP
jgi:SAM-dependent methyltransferase